ncbi:MAG: hypothetical protein HC795_17320 [Coleofasciculaceae cyanobacterium RL_1_1]|jgi:hypothetical protein|nr:hypothetical protein [Coleofasciculaceae cyanobacterium RL_1_1]
MEPVEIAIFGGIGLVAAGAVGSLLGKSQEQTQKACDEFSDAIREATKSGLVCAVKAFDETKAAIDEANLNFQSLLEDARAEAARTPKNDAPRQVDITSN